MMPVAPFVGDPQPYYGVDPFEDDMPDDARTFKKKKKKKEEHHHHHYSHKQQLHIVVPEYSTYIFSFS